MILRFRILAPLALMAAALFAGAPARAAEWPLTGSLIAHDPTLIREGDSWWCFYTGKGLPSKTSPDGRAWTLRSPLFSKELSWWRTYAPKMGAVDVWAPDVHHFGQRYWLYYCVSEFGKNNSAIGLMSCTSLALGDWRDEGVVLSSKAGIDTYNALDPNLTVDAAGRPWLVFGSWFSGIYIVPIDPATMKPAGVPRNLAYRENGIEGPVVVYRDGYYYLFTSIDRCCRGADSNYKISVGRSRAITGPYVDEQGKDMMAGGGTIIERGGPRWRGPGGQDVRDFGGHWLLVRHSYDAEHKGEPTLRIADLYFDKDGWPTLAKPGR